MLFAGGPAAAALMRQPDEQITERFLADLHALYPQTRGVIADAKVHRWELGNVYAQPGAPSPAGAAGGRARRPRATSTSPVTTSPSWATWRPPPGPERSPPSASRRTLRDRPTPPEPRSTMPDFHGVLPALITPFTEDGAADRRRRAAPRSSTGSIGAGVGGLVPGRKHRRVHHAQRRRAPRS